MAKKLYEESNIQAIANAIREKNGETTTYKTSEMANAISAITTGEGGGGIEVEPIVLSDRCNYACSGPIANNYIKLFGNTITTENITYALNMFHKYEGEIIPFEINGDKYDSVDLSGMFINCNYLVQIPKINNMKPSKTFLLFNNCNQLRYLPNDIADWFDWSYITTSSGTNRSSMFEQCYSLRSIPMDFLAPQYPSITYNYSYLQRGFGSCYALDELVGLPIPYTANWTGNAFFSTFDDCHRLKRITFETNEDGTPKIMNWKSQTMDLSQLIGYNYIIGYNSGITADKEVTDNATYQALKNDPDWFTTKIEYSRYNHDSAVETINSLPDTSAYLAANGGTNTIKFTGASGSATDGGAINTMTEEEIAVATAKGWTVTLV